MLKRVDLFPEKVKSLWFRDHWLALSTITLIILFIGGAIGLAKLTKASPQAILPEQKIFSADNVKNLKKDLSPQNQTAEAIDQKLKSENFTGTALVIKDGKIILNQGYGFANYSKQVHNNAQTVYHIASSAKFLTAVLVGQAISEKKLSYDDHLSQFYPNIANADQISIRDLLTMTSSLQQKLQPTTFTSDQDNAQFSADNTENTGAAIGSGAGWSYQPVNYRLLAGILMKVSGQSFDKMVKDYYNKQYKLGIDDYVQFAEDNQAALGYQKDTTSPTGVTKVENERETGTGNLAMSAGMLYRAYWLFFHGDFFQNPMELLVQHLPAHYVSGLYRYGNVYTSHGIFNGFEPSVVLGKNSQDAVILLANQYYHGHSFEGLSRDLYEKLTGTKVPS
ncbi:serine hydrolase [uncultured Fructobacillus sp.]|uniref:serine hydrolase domain-containing protein n=1 Tax=uncultured Fructobacillus sp. TaxID=591942 RepID=UPI002595703D|nr:serine hydrolase domain-containing protein [uncultured Fructobacillus sp.]